MKCILPCAGYATRLYPLTENFPKALLDIEENKPLLNYTIEEINRIDEIDEIFLITNDRFYEIFKKWADEINNKKPIYVVNDHTTCNDDRLGTIGDLEYLINTRNIDDDLLIVLGDNLFDFSLRPFVDFAKQKHSFVVGGQTENDKNLLMNLGVIEADSDLRVIGFEEKPAEPKGNIKSLGIYFYPKETIPVIKQYLEEGNRPDAPGYFVSYLYSRQNVYTYPFEGTWFDIGSPSALEQVRKLYQNK